MNLVPSCSLRAWDNIKSHPQGHLWSLPRISIEGVVPGTAPLAIGRGGEG